MSCPYFQKTLTHNAPNPPLYTYHWFKSCTDFFATRAVPYKKPDRREKRRRSSRRKKRGMSEDKMKMQHCNQPACREGGWRQASKVFRACNLEIFLSEQPAARDGGQAKQTRFSATCEKLLSAQPGSIGTQMEAKEARLSMQP